MKNISNKIDHKFLFLSAAAFSLFPFISPAIALSIGLLIAQLIKNPFAEASQKATNLLLQLSVICLGFGMNISNVIRAGENGILFTIGSIFTVLILGYVLGRMLKIDLKTSSLISAGTAICGGSAIAALSPVMKANPKQISVALGTVFMLNSGALFIFPVLGHWLHLSQSQFGMWCALAIHDTSSVVGAASRYGEEALQIATTVKLARALWIVPVSLLASVIFKTEKAKMQIPYFIGLFLLAILANTYIPAIAKSSRFFVDLAQSGFSLTLFLIGSGLSFEKFKQVGPAPLVQGALLWISISAASLYLIILLF